MSAIHPPTTRPTDGEIIAAMRRFGGGFASRLAEAAKHADYNNLQRLKSAFPEIWADYAKMAILERSEP